ncbi:MAG TPA: hypothetical protein PKC97_19555 [Burkholderiaceae bacterium]|nr:hypothetical protein [Burkholderiaceae bacterium]
MAEIERGEFVTLEDLLPASLSSRQRLSMPLPVKIGVRVIYFMRTAEGEIVLAEPASFPPRSSMPARRPDFRLCSSPPCLV